MSWDNMTLNGLFLKDSKCYANHNQDCVTNNTTISMDMPDNATKYRFDLYAEETRSNGTIPYTKIGHKIWYLKRDLERVLRDNYIMFNIRERYGKGD